MSELSEIDRLREAVDTLAGASLPPDHADLRRRAAQRGRRRVAVAAAGTLAAVVVGAAALGDLGSREESSPVDRSPAPTPTPSTPVQLELALEDLVTDVPGWELGSIPVPNAGGYAFNGRCSTDWGPDATGGGDGGFFVAGHGTLGFATEARAHTAAATLTRQLERCTVIDWQVVPVPGTGTLLATQPEAVAWIQQRGDTVSVLQLPTEDGAPPERVQVAVAEWMASYDDLRQD